MIEMERAQREQKLLAGDSSRTAQPKSMRRASSISPATSSAPAVEAYYRDREEYKKKSSAANSWFGNSDKELNERGERLGYMQDQFLKLEESSSDYLRVCFLISDYDEKIIEFLTICWVGSK